MLVIKISTLVLIIIIAFLLGFVFSPITMLIERIKSHKKDGEQNESD